MNKPARVLSIDGGGIRGIIPCMILKELEGRAQRPISDLFDLIVGTSSGGIISLGLSLPGERGMPKYDAKSLATFFEREGRNIFHVPVWKRVESAWNLLDEKYPEKGLEEVLSRYFGESRLKDALRPVMVPAYETESRSPWFFRSERARVSPNFDFPMKDVARAIMATPTYFPPKKLESGGDYHSLIDGCVFGNNPGMCAYVEARKMYPERDGFIFVSLGSGKLTRRIPHEDARDWGLAQWAHPLLNVMFDGQGDVVDHQLRELLQFSGKRKRYFRFQTRLDNGNDDMDDSRARNIHALKKEAKEMIDSHSEDLDLLSELLVER
ncbi:MAG: patatin [Thermoplasmata archaeon]|nr:MAG: patatin [Thermoplasmatales archaeon ex4484_6]RLF56806.1 MAG: patatin [Thermoplasmata archaeon]RLF69229.1 MAG: patatin [Thermoplasmata archaeon]